MVWAQDVYKIIEYLDDPRSLFVVRLKVGYVGHNWPVFANFDYGSVRELFPQRLPLASKVFLDH